jgi:hypothetical protein
MGFSKSFSSFCNNTLTIVCSQVKENRNKSFIKSGLASIGYLVNATLISSKILLGLWVPLDIVSLPKNEKYVLYDFG